MWLADSWKDYEVLDTSAGEKLERWGKYILVRPDPQVIWNTPKDDPLWRKYDARYARSNTGGGKWQNLRLPAQWQAFLIERPGATHYFRPKNSAHWELQFLSMNAVCGSILRNIINEYGNIYTLPPACPVLNCWEKLYGLAVNKQIDNFFTASSYTYEFIMALHDTLRALPGLRHSNNRLQNCVEAIQANYQSNLTLTQMAQICNLSPSYLTKIFKENFKTTPVQYLIKYRIEMACRLLQRSDMRIEDIALQTGFGSGNYFSRIFKSVVGVSPKDYRKEQNLELLTAQETQELIVRYEMLK